MKEGNGQGRFWLMVLLTWRHVVRDESLIRLRVGQLDGRIHLWARVSPWMLCCRMKQIEDLVGPSGKKKLNNYSILILQVIIITLKMQKEQLNRLSPKFLTICPHILNKILIYKWMIKWRLKMKSNLQSNTIDRLSSSQLASDAIF